MSETRSTREQSVTRGEFMDAIEAIGHKIEGVQAHTSAKIDEINRAKQVSWQLVVAIAGFLFMVMAALVGFGVKNLSDVSTLISVSGAQSRSLEAMAERMAALEPTVEANRTRIQINTGIIDELRERTRGLEANLAAVSTENETQHKWIADVLNLEASHSDRMARLIAAQSGVAMPERSYFPLHNFGAGYQLNGKKH